MAVRKKNAQSRLTLVRECYMCGQVVLTQADTPWVRQLYNVEGKKQKTVYFCSESCKKASYIYNMDGHAEERKQAKRTPEQIREKNRRYYLAHIEKERARSRAAYHSRTPEENQAINRHNRRQAALRKSAEQEGDMLLHTENTSSQRISTSIN